MNDKNESEIYSELPFNDIITPWLLSKYVKEAINAYKSLCPAPK